ncbi:MAG TPA: TraR/DksA C4-type zinc finger protein [Actinomycetota bacterium]|nr:TraR/DksA C4-type zinc finger protein [Actinomycetota bacterium]
MDAAQLDRARTALEELRSDLRNQLADLGANPDEDSLDNVEYDGGFADSAQSTAERGKVLALIDRLRDQLRQVDHARLKMEQGTYGKCESCGEPIGPERLEALPYSTLCVNCKQKG